MWIDTTSCDKIWMCSWKWLQIRKKMKIKQRKLWVYKLFDCHFFHIFRSFSLFSLSFFLSFFLFFFLLSSFLPSFFSHFFLTLSIYYIRKMIIQIFFKWIIKSFGYMNVMDGLKSKAVSTLAKTICYYVN